jgi:hypothetical protein
MTESLALLNYRIACNAASLAKRRIQPGTFRNYPSTSVIEYAL